MTFIDPELQKYMHQQRLQNWFSSMAQGLLGAAAGGKGLGAGLLQGLGSANAGGGGLDLLSTQAQLERLTAGRADREKAREQDFATKALAAGPQYDPDTEILWNQPPMKGREPRGTTGQEARSLLAQADPGMFLKGVAGQMFPGPAKPPTVRDFKVGDEYITRQWSPEAGDWQDVGRAPRYKPPDIDVDLGGVVGEMGQMMTEAGASKRAIDLEDRRVAVTQMAAQGADLIGNLVEGGDRAVSWTGGLARGLENLSSQTKALTNEVGFNVDPKRFEFPGNLAGESSVIKSQILGLAAAVTKADQGSRPSDFDVQMSLNRLGASSGSSETMARTIKSMLDEKMNDFAIDYRVRSGKDFDWGSEMTRHGIEFPELSAPPVITDFTKEQLEREMQRRGLIPGG